MSSRRRVLQLREPLAQAPHGLHRLVDRERGLRQPDDLVGVAHLDVRHVVGAVDDGDVVGRLAGGALDLFVALVADEQDLEVVAREAHGLAVHLGDERAGRVDRLQAAIGCRVHDRRRHAVRAEDDVRALGHLVDLVDEDRALLLELGHDVDVVHDLLAHVDRRAVALERLLDGDHGAVDAGAVAARRGEQHPLVSGDGDILERLAPPRNAGHAEADPRGIRTCCVTVVHPTRADAGASRPTGTAGPDDDVPARCAR